MTLSLHRRQPAVYPPRCNPRVVPAAAVWDSAGEPAGPGRSVEIRRLAPEIRTDKRSIRPELDAGVRSADGGGHRFFGETAQAYLVGGIFGLSLVVGAVLAGADEEPGAVPPTPAEQSVESLR